jgi:hypothetical protein
MRISYGIESVDDNILLSMRKKIKVKDIEHGLAETRKAKIGIQGNILFGDPAETEDTFNNSLSWWMKHPEYDLSLFTLLTIPDAPVYQQAVQKGLIKNKMEFMKDGFPLINLTSLSDDRFKMMISRIARLQSDSRYKTRGVIVRSRLTKVASTGENLYSMAICCPECKETLTYNNMHQNGVMEYFPIFCKGCQRRFYIGTLSAFPKNFTVLEKAKFKASYMLSNFYNRIEFLRYYVEKSPRVLQSVRQVKKYLLTAPA